MLGKVQNANLDFDDMSHKSNKKSDLLWNSHTNKVSLTPNDLVFYRINAILYND